MSNQNLNAVISARRIINGPDDKLRAISTVRYPWAIDLFKQMCANNWDFEQVPLVRDRYQFHELKKGQQTAYLRSLAFLSNLDAIQVDNLAANVGQIITDPNIRECIYRQQFEEVIHVRAYSAIIETVFPQDPLSIYNLYNEVPQLAAKNNYIINKSKEVTLDPSDENKVKAIVSNIALEGIYFYSGFFNFYAIGRDTGTMIGSVDEIRYIQRDEVTHLKLFTHIFNSLRQERPELFTPQLLEECRAILHDAAQLEKAWGKFAIEDGMPGVNNEIMDAFIEHRADEAAEPIGLGKIFGTPNPAPWFYDYSNVNNGQRNFFETKPLTYQETQPVFRSRRALATTGR